MPMYNLIEYSDNYSDTLRGLWDFKRDEIVDNANVANDVILLYLNIKQILLVIRRQWNKKRSKNSCTTRIFKSFLEIIRNAID